MFDSMIARHHVRVVLIVPFLAILAIGGRQIAGGAEPREAGAWESVSLYDPDRDKLPGGTVTSVAVSPDGKRFAAADISPDIKIWDAQSQKLLVMIMETGADVSATVPFKISQDAPAGRTRSLAFSPDGRLLAGGGSGKSVQRPEGFFTDSGEVLIWEASTGKLIRKFDLPYEVLSIAFDHDGTPLVAATYDRRVKVWSVSDGKLLLDLEHPKSGRALDHVHAVAFSPDGKLIASAGNGSIVLWDSQTGRAVRTVHGETYFPSVAFDPTGKRLAAASAETGGRAAAVVWDVETGNRLLTLKGDEYGTKAVAFSPDGRQIASANGRDAATAGQHFGGSIRIWEADSGKELSSISVDPNPALALAYTPAGDRLLVGAGSIVKLWQVKDKR